MKFVNVHDKHFETTQANFILLLKIALKVIYYEKLS